MNFYVIRNDETEDKIVTINALKEKFKDDFDNRVLIVNQNNLRWNNIPEAKRNKLISRVKGVHAPNKEDQNTIGQIILVDFYDSKSDPFVNIDEKEGATFYEQICEKEKIWKDNELVRYLKNPEEFRSEELKQATKWEMENYKHNYLKEIINNKFSRQYSFYVETEKENSALSPLTIENLNKAADKYNNLNYSGATLWEGGYLYGCATDNLIVVNNKTGERYIFEVNKNLKNLNNKKSLSDVLADNINTFSKDSKNVNEWCKERASKLVEYKINRMVYGNKEFSVFEKIGSKIETIFKR